MAKRKKRSSLSMGQRHPASGELLAEAERLEARQRAAEAACDAAAVAEARQPWATSPPDGIRTMFHLATGFRIGGMALTLLASLFGGAVLFLLAIDQSSDAFERVGFFGFAATCVPAPLAWVVTLLRYPVFRGWRLRVPFAVDGDWEALVCPREASDHWRHCSVRVVVGPEGAVAANAALRIFAVRANRSTYLTRWGRIERWRVHDQTAIGDANVRVAWKLYRFLSGDLSRLARRGLTVERVVIKASAESRCITAEDIG